MKLLVSAAVVLGSFSTAIAEQRDRVSENGLGINDTSLVLLNTGIPGELSSLEANDSQAPHPGTYYNDRNRVELQITRTGRVSSNIVITNGNVQHPVEFTERLRETRFGWASRGNYTVQYLTSYGLLFCTYPVNLLLNFFAEGDGAEAEFEYPTYAGISAYGQCVHGPMRVEVFELEKDVERQ